MFQFCLKISYLPFLIIYSMLLTLLSNYPEPCLTLLFGLVMFSSSWVFSDYPTAPRAHAASREQRQPHRLARSLWENQELSSLCSPQILLTFQHRAVVVNYWLQKSQWQHFHLWEGQEFSPFLFTCLLHTSVLSNESSCVDAVLMQSSYYCHPTYFYNYINWTEASKQ